MFGDFHFPPGAYFNDDVNSKAVIGRAKIIVS